MRLQRLLLIRSVIVTLVMVACTASPTLTPTPIVPTVEATSISISTTQPTATKLISTPIPTSTPAPTKLPTPTISANLLSPCFTTGTPPITFGCYIETIAGGNLPGRNEGGLATQAVLKDPQAVLAASDGAIYISDTQNNRVLRVTPDGKIETFAGTGSADNQPVVDGIPAKKSTLKFPRGLAEGSDGSIYIADTNHYRIRKINRAGIISTVAGTGNAGYFGEGIPATQAGFAGAFAVAVDVLGNIYVADTAAHRIRRIDTNGIIKTIAGTGVAGTTGDGGPAVEAKIDFPNSLVLDNKNGLIFAERSSGALRRIDLDSGIISTIPNVPATFVAIDGNGAIYLYSNRGGQLSRLDRTTNKVSVVAGSPPRGTPLAGLSVDLRGNIYVADTGNDRILRISANGSLDTIAGGGIIEGDTVSAEQAIIYDTRGLGFDKYGSLFFSDAQNKIIRKMGIDGLITRVVGSGKPSTTSLTDNTHPLKSYIGPPLGIAFDKENNLIFLNEDNSVGVVGMITPGSDGVINGSSDERIITIAGQFRPRTEADHGQADGKLATSAVFDAARGFALDSKGNLYIADIFDHRIRKVTPGSDGIFNLKPDEIITTIAGNGIGASSGDGGLATQASISSPTWIAFDTKDNLYIREQTSNGAGSFRIRRVDATTGIITTYTTIQGGSNGKEIAFDSSDNLFYTTGNKIVRVDAKTGKHDVVAGTSEQGYRGDGGDALKASFMAVAFMTFDKAGNIYVIDSGNFRIRKITLVPLGK